MDDVLEELRSWIGENHRRVAVCVGGLWVAVKVGSTLKEIAAARMTQQMLKKWEEESPKDVVTLHTLPRGKTVPNLSPFAMKLETYLRMSKIPYQADFENAWGPLGKTPWITLNGSHMADSQLIIQFLSRERGVVLGADYTEEQQAVGRAVRIVMDEYLYWGIGLWRYVYSNGVGLDKIFNMPQTALRSLYASANQRVKQGAWVQGVGRHSQAQVVLMMNDTLRTASLLLGNKQFLLGDEPSEYDCSLFGFLAMVMWGTPGSPYEKYLQADEELANLRAYCTRMKQRFWDDWEQCLAK